MTTLENAKDWRASVSEVPRHVGIIMDGNGRWAAARGLRRYEGHRKGIESVRNAVRYACDTGILYLTLFSFSSENWSRPPQEVSDLMQLLKIFIRRDLAKLHKEGVKIRVIGTREGVADDILKLLDDAQTLTDQNTRLVLTLAFNYGSRDEITRSAIRLARKVENGELQASDITSQLLEDHLDTAGLPNPDLLIRTSGELRLSNFLLWQCAYSELVFLDTYWPDFTKEAFEGALIEYQNRERRFGGLKERSIG
ncbi:MAG: isoprenyl transferase [bacterium]|nr:isoprenyl transferase [bacterium]